MAAEIITSRVLDLFRLDLVGGADVGIDHIMPPHDQDCAMPVDQAVREICGDRSWRPATGEATSRRAARMPIFARNRHAGRGQGRLDA
ncbi:hypothetical protein MOQ72_14570 [Saccharopolyspora sp. K220]|uniref:hypothetical protein n=1 Tax=Saccharopolyspora soli TaxID=2926618 RepID=UPI001F5A4B9C|nr:hypothetical protein [Saccharopolyspora soli]MCI2418661.1 hypothetical protein [Saccharopolyspora soli]